MQHIERLVIKVSGRLMTPPRPAYLKAFRDAIETIFDKVEAIGIVVGGGDFAKEYIGALREIGVPESRLDLVGIEVSRLNALVLAQALYPMSYLRVPETLDEAVDMINTRRVVVLGGLQPGQSTNAVAASLADAIGASLLINLLSDVDGIYIPAPGVPGATRANRLSCEELRQIVRDMPQVAGAYDIFDHIAVDIASRAKLRIFFTSGKDPSVLANILEGTAVGTTVEC